MVAALSSASLINCEVVLVLVIRWEVGKKMEMAQMASHSTKMETPGR